MIHLYAESIPTVGNVDVCTANPNYVTVLTGIATALTTSVS